METVLGKRLREFVRDGRWWCDVFYSHYADMDPENQNFLLDSNAGKKKYETQYVST